MKYLFFIFIMGICSQNIIASGLHVPDDISSHKKTLHVIKKKKIISDVTEDSWSPISSIKKNHLKPTTKTISEHDNMINMLKNIGFNIDEEPTSLVFNLPYNYKINKNNKDGDIPDAIGFMRAMSLSNEVVDRHFLIFPEDDKLSVELKTNRGKPLLSYDINRNEWEKAEGAIGLTTQTLNGKDSSGILQSLKVSSMVRNIKR